MEKPIYFSESTYNDLFRKGWGHPDSASGQDEYLLRNSAWYMEGGGVKRGDYFAMERPERVYVSGIMYASGYDPEGNKRRMTLYVRPTNRLIRWLAKNMIGMADDRIQFEAIMRQNGETLITARYNTIIGNRWLLVLPTTDFMELINR